MVQAISPPITLAEFLAQPETKPAREFVTGQVIQKEMPQGKHSRLQSRLVTVINDRAEADHLALALPELRCTFGERSLVPDIAVFEWSRLPFDADGDIANMFNRAPDWTIEILSPGQSSSRVVDNLLYCLNAGGQMGWLINPQDKDVLVFPAGKQPIAVRGAEELLPIPDFMPALELSLGEVFGWLKPGSR